MLIPLANRSILHLDLDTFFVSVERLKNSKLNARPVIIGGTSGRGVVASCSYETRQFGVRSGMPMRFALRLCPEAIVLRGDYDGYSQSSDLVTAIVKDSVPTFEKASIDEFYIDLTGFDKFFGCLKYASHLREKIIRECGLPLSFGLSLNKLVSKIATGQAKPNNQLCIAYGTEMGFMAPLPVGKIPMVGEDTQKRLNSLGVKSVGKLQQIPLKYLEQKFGKNGITLHQKAHAIDNSPVVPYSEQKSISTESTFQTDTIDVNFLEAKLLRMAEEVSHQLRRQNRLTGCITIKLRYSDFQTYTIQKQVPYTAFEPELISFAKELFRKLYDRRLLVRLLGVKLSKLVGGHHQMDLFRNTPKEIALHSAIDRMRNRFGERAVMRAGGM